MALSTKALGAIVGVGELLREEEQRRCEVDESIRKLCLRAGDRVFASLKQLGGRKGPYQEGAAGARHAQVRNEEGAHPRAPRLRGSRERALPGLGAQCRRRGRTSRPRLRRAGAPGHQKVLTLT